MTDRAEPALREAAVRDVLAGGDLQVTGRLVDASNDTFFAEARGDGHTIPCVYKPVRGERPLWDFPDGTLAGRELAAYLVSESGGWHVVPPTVLGDGPFGVGMIQQWIEVDVASPQVAVVPAGDVPDGWFAVLDAYDVHERPVMLLHRDDGSLRALALFDAVVNNADRKGGHLLPTGSRVLGCDHGLTFHVEDKLRTVLWGWEGKPLTAAEHDQLTSLAARLREGALRSQLLAVVTPAEVEALEARVDVLRTEGSLPEHGDRWPTIPWPPL